MRADILSTQNPAFLFLLGRTPGSPKTTPVPSVWLSPDLPSAPEEASPAQEYRLRLKQPAPTLSPSLGGSPLFKYSTRLVPRGPCPSRPFFRGALLALRFRLEKYAQHTFSTETERRKNSGSSQSLASLLRLTEPTNQID